MNIQSYLQFIYSLRFIKVISKGNLQTLPESAAAVCQAYIGDEELRESLTTELVVLK